MMGIDRMMFGLRAPCTLGQTELEEAKKRETKKPVEVSSHELCGIIVAAYILHSRVR